MSTDFRALCARMADELDHYRQLLMDDRRETHALATEARAALAQPEPPSLKEQALNQLREVNAMLQFQTTGGETSAIRRALEQLDD